LKIRGKTDKGLVRPTNQDAFEVFALSADAVCAVVCDGMGGAKAGNVASSMAVETIAENIKGNYRENMNADFIKTMLFTAIGIANIKVYEEGTGNPEYAGMGTTVVTVIVSGGAAYVAHVGDSRAYKLCSNGIRQLTTDHSMVQVLVERGELTQSEAKSHPKKNLITRALGAESTVNVDYAEEPLADGESILICTDGLSNPVEDAEILKIMNEEGFDTCVEKLISAAKEKGGNDNITAVVIS